MIFRIIKNEEKENTRLNFKKVKMLLLRIKNLKNLNKYFNLIYKI